MNTHYDQIRKILLDFKEEYKSLCASGHLLSPKTPITERDIVSELYCCLKAYCKNRKLAIHTEIKPVPSANLTREQFKRFPIIDLVILQGNWMPAAIKIQNKYLKGSIEARFGAVPLKYFHTAIEVKIQSHVGNAKKDINTLASIKKKNKSCNCYMVILNARGRRKDHESVLKCAEKQDIFLVEHTNDEIVE